MRTSRLLLAAYRGGLMQCIGPCQALSLYCTRPVSEYQIGRPVLFRASRILEYCDHATSGSSRVIDLSGVVLHESWGTATSLCVSLRF